MTGKVILLYSICLPLAGAILIGLASRRPNLREGISLSTAILLFLGILKLREIGTYPELSLCCPLPEIEIALRLEPLGLIFALVASCLWILTTLYAIGYMRGNNEANQTRFYVCFAIAISATMGIALAANLLTLFIFYEMLTFSTYPLVTHKGNDASRLAGRKYLGILLSTSICFFLLAIAWTWQLAGTLNFTPGGILAGKTSPALLAFLFLLFAFGAGKAALMPFHRWLPAAMVAPTPVSALLHAVAVVKAGVFTILKTTIYIFGIDLLQETSASTLIAWIAAGSILLASFVALKQDNLKSRLAYSTISQLSYIVLGASLATTMSITGSAMHIVMHAFGKITLFFCAGAIYTAAHKTEISDMDGLGRVMPVTYAAFLIGSCSIIGLPPMGGAWSKWFLMLGALDAGQLVLMAVYMLSTLLNVAYFFPIIARGFFLAAPSSKIKEASMACLLPLVLTALACILLFFFANDIYSLIKTIPLEK